MEAAGWPATCSVECIALDSCKSAIKQLLLHETTEKLFASHRGGGASIYNCKTGQTVQSLVEDWSDGEYSDFAPSLSLIENATKVISGGGDALLKIWDVETGSLLSSLEGHSKVITGVFANDRAAISCSEDDCINVWDVRKKKCLKTLYPSGDVLQVKALQNNIITATPHGVKVWDMAKAQVAHEFRVGGCMRFMDISADKTKLLIGTTDKNSHGIISIFNTANWEEVVVIRTLGEGGKPFEGAFNVYLGEGNLICGGLNSDANQPQGKIHFFDPNTWQYRHSLKDAHGSQSYCFAVGTRTIFGMPACKGTRPEESGKIQIYSF